MKNKFYLHEFQIFDGEAWITFNIVDLNELKNEIWKNLVVTENGIHYAFAYVWNKDDACWRFL